MRAALDDHAILGSCDAGPEFFQLRYHGGDAIGLFDAQLAGIADDCLPLGQRRRHADHRELVDGARHKLAADLDALEGGAVYQQIGDRLARQLARIALFDVRPHGFEDIQNPAPGRVDADMLEQQLRAGDQRGRDQEKSGGRNISRHMDLFAGKPGLRLDAYAVGEGLEFGTEIAQHPLAVITRKVRLEDRRRGIGVEPGQQQGRLDLGAGDGRAVRDALQASSLDCQGRQLATAATVNQRPHFAQRLHDSAHRTATQVLIAREHAEEVLPREQTGH